ncbi:MAG: hypothetical protein IJQ03_01315, partial [Firmicutes bacterium]|nr:hypothetical protein [Bacillota bacterium]
ILAHQVSVLSVVMKLALACTVTTVKTSTRAAAKAAMAISTMGSHTVPMLEMATKSWSVKIVWMRTIPTVIIAGSIISAAK